MIVLCRKIEFGRALKRYVPSERGGGFVLPQ